MLPTIQGLLLGCEGLGFTIGAPIGSFLVSVSLKYDIQMLSLECQTHTMQTHTTHAQVSDYRVPFWTVGAIILLLIPLAFLVVKPTGMNTYCQCCISKLVISTQNHSLLKSFHSKPCSNS